MDDVGIKSSGSSTPLEDNINVVVRVRPVSEKEIKAKDESVMQFPGNGQILVSLRSKSVHQFELQLMAITERRSQ